MVPFVYFIIILLQRGYYARFYADNEATRAVFDTVDPPPPPEPEAANAPGECSDLFNLTRQVLVFL